MHHPTTKDRLSSLLNQLFIIADLAISQFITTTKEYACRSIDSFLKYLGVLQVCLGLPDQV